MITKKEIVYPGFGNCLEISNGTVKLITTLDFGPRLINFSFIDGENVMFEDKDRTFFVKDKAMEELFGDDTWYTYGGHRLWVSPEGHPRSYYPDNEPITYRLTESGAVLTPPVQKWNQHAHVIEISMAENTTDVTVIHRLTNKAAWPVQLSLWPITVLAQGGTEIVPQPTKDTGLLANRWMALWPYSKMNDPRVTWGERYITLRQDPANNDAFKVGISSEHGFAIYCYKGNLFVKQFKPVQGGCYPDGGMSFETYTNPLFLEMESLGELVTLEPGETTEHTEYWSLYQEAMPEASEEAYDALVKKYVR